MFGAAAAIFHLFTHAFFKALLFLSSGSVMHAMGNVIDMRRFSGLRHVLPITHATFLCGAAALAGIPIFAQLATSLADAGFMAVRYDKRGTGQSGGRSESAAYDDYASDIRDVITYLSKRKDVDPKKIAVLGFGEGGWIALTLAGREPRVAALVLVGTPSAKGIDLVLEQQRQLFERSETTPAAQEQAVAQQKQILQAVVTGKDWDALSPAISDPGSSSSSGEMPELLPAADFLGLSDSDRYFCAHSSQRWSSSNCSSARISVMCIVAAFVHF